MNYMTSTNMIPNVHNNSIDAPRKRTRATPEQLSILEKTFTVNPSPNNRIREQLSRELGMTERSIQIWFQNRRAKVKNVAKKTSILHNETLRMQYYASSAAAAACQAAAYNQQQRNGVKDEDQLQLDPIESNPDLYYYYYYYYFNHQQQRQKHRHSLSSVPPPISLKSLPPLPPPPPPPSSLDGSKSPMDTSKWSRKPIPQQRTRAHTIGPYYPTGDNFDMTLFQRGTSVDLHTENTYLLDNISPTQLTLSDQQESASPSFFDLQQQFTTWTNLPFYQDLVTPLSPMLINKFSIESLQIGSWKRMKFEPDDLVCQYDGRLFSWCIRDGVSKFKIDIPLAAVHSMQLNTLTSRPGWARLEFELKEGCALEFYMHSQDQGWVQCRDFTEEKQATCVLLHQLDGPALPLKAELDTLVKDNPALSSIYIY